MGMKANNTQQTTRSSSFALCFSAAELNYPLGMTDHCVVTRQSRFAHILLLGTLTSDEGRGIQRSMIRLLLDDPNVIGRVKYKLDERAAPPIHPCSFSLLCGVSLAVVRDIGARRDYEFMGQLSIVLARS